MSSLVLAQSDLPIGIQKIIEYNFQTSYEILLSVSFFVAFVAGILGILSPCILPFIPAYFSYSFKEKKNITKMTLIFFLGFSAVFVTMGIIAGFIGEQSLLLLQAPWIVRLAGAFLVIMGIITALGLGFEGLFKHKVKPANDNIGTFLFGMFFALGWSACLGPILAGILGIGVYLHNWFYSGILLLFYSLGNLAPLFLLAIYWDKHHLENSKWLKGKVYTFKILGKKFYTVTIKIISGLLFILIGVVMLIYKGTSVVNTWDVFNTKQYFYLLQEKLIAWQYNNILGAVLFIIFIGLLYWGLKRKKRNKE
tara:strand:- start:1689 stop:2615 length:927 start_codon:yes stop_codon:yes gene_type:complete